MASSFLSSISSAVWSFTLNWMSCCDCFSLTMNSQLNANKLWKNNPKQLSRTKCDIFKSLVFPHQQSKTPKHIHLSSKSYHVSSCTLRICGVSLFSLEKWQNLFDYCNYSSSARLCKVNDYVNWGMHCLRNSWAAGVISRSVPCVSDKPDPLPMVC